MKQPLAFLSLVAGFFLFPASFYASGFVYSELLMAMAIVCVLLGMHLQATATQPAVEKELSRTLFGGKSIRETIQQQKTPLMPLTQNEMSSVVNQ